MKKEFIQFRLEFENYDVAYNKIQPQSTKEQIKKTMEMYEFPKEMVNLEPFKNNEKAEKRNAIKRAEAGKRQLKSSAIRLIGYRVNQFFTDKITYEELYDYVKYNHPAFLEKLPDYVKKRKYSPTPPKEGLYEGETF